MSQSIRERILAADDIKVEMVPVPEWGVDIEVRGMNGVDRGAILDAAAANDGETTASTMFLDVVLATAYDPISGTRIFTDADRGALAQKSAAALDRVALVGMRLSGMEGQAVDDAKKQFPDESDEATDV